MGTSVSEFLRWSYRTLMPPPRYIPKQLDTQFASDPFDPRFIQGGTKDRHLTSLGIVVELWFYYHKNSITEPAGIIRSLEECMLRECPKVLKELTCHLPAHLPVQKQTALIE